MDVGPPGVEGPVVGVHEPCKAALYLLDELWVDRCVLTAAALVSCAGAGVLKTVASAFSTGGGEADLEPLSCRSSSSSLSTRACVGLRGNVRHALR